jgi:hypothetical protein
VAILPILMLFFRLKSIPFARLRARGHFKELDANLHYPQLVSMSFCTQSDRAIVF